MRCERDAPSATRLPCYAAVPSCCAIPRPRLRTRELDLAIALVLDPLVDLIDGPPAHPALLLLLHLLHRVPEAEVLRHGARVVLPPELQTVIHDVARLLAVVKRLVRLLLLGVLLVLGLAPVPHVLLVVEVLPVLGLVFKIDVVPHVVEVVVVHVVPVLELGDEAWREPLVVEVADEERGGLPVGGVRDALLLVLPHAGDLLAVELVEGRDGLAPLAGAEGQREGLAAVDGRELRGGVSGRWKPTWRVGG